MATKGVERPDLVGELELDTMNLAVVLHGNFDQRRRLIPGQFRKIKIRIAVLLWRM
jgi:hypothetical protein